MMNATLPSPPTACSAQLQDRVGDLAVVHDHRDAAGDADDQRHAEQVARAVDERVVTAAFSAAARRAR